MTYKEFAEKAEEIIQAIDEGNYEVDLEEPNFVKEFERDGHLYLIVVDRDGPKTSNYCGNGDYTICGEKFHHEFSFYNDEEPESDFFDKAKVLEGSPDDIDDDVDDIIEQIKEKISELAPGFDDVDEQAEAYANARGIKYEQAFWYEDSDCPRDEEDDDYDY